MLPPTAQSRQRAIETAHRIIAGNPVYIDTETTGIDRTDEIVEISIIGADGGLVFNSLVRPTQPIKPAASAIHGMTTEMLANAPSWLILYPQIRSHLFGKVVAGYNVDFDVRMMVQSHARYKLPWKDNLNTLDVMRIFAEYRAEWDSYRRSYRIFKLEEAGQFLKIPMPNAHRSTADALLTRAVLHAIAGQPY